MAAGKQSLPLQSFKFLAVGAMNTLIDVGLYLPLTRFLGLAALPAPAKSLSYSAGVANSYVWIRRWTFGSEATVRATRLPFVVSSLMALAINAGILHLCLDVLHVLDLLALVLATAVTLAWNFASGKLVIFRK